jgi:hypothetical protein
MDILQLAGDLGLDPDRIAILPVTAQVELLNEETPDTLAIAKTVAKTHTEAAGPLGEDGKPRMLRLTAWIAHAGKPNRNGDAFTAEDLEQAVREGQFSPPNLVMVDFNHDFNAYGAWYKASFGRNPLNNELGILAEGVIFAWRFDELSNFVLAEQARNGTLEISMACMFDRIERQDDGSHLLRNPKFLAVSVLSVTAADPNAKGVGSEDPSSTPEQRKDLLAAASQVTARWVVKCEEVACAGNPSEEEDMDYDKLLADIRKALQEGQTDQVMRLAEALKDVFSSADHSKELTEQLETATARVTELEDALAEAQEGAQTEVDALKVALDAKTTEYTELKAERDSLAEKVDAFEEAEAEAEREALREARIAELPESYITVLEGREEAERERIVAHLVEMDEDVFKSHVEVLKAGLASESGTPTRVEKSELEGALTAVTSPPSGGYRIDQFF